MSPRPLPPADRRCRAKSKASGEQCPQYAMKGGKVCYHHGGNSPVVKAAAARRLATQVIQERVDATLAHEGITAVEDPLAELGKLASASKAMTEALGARVNALGTELEHSGGEKYSPVIKAELMMYERALDRTHRLLDSLIKAGYTERQVSIAEAEALLVAGVIRRVIAGLGLSPEQQAQASTLLAAEFRALEAQK